MTKEEEEQASVKIYEYPS